MEYLTVYSVFVDLLEKLAMLDGSVKEITLSPNLYYQLEEYVAKHGGAKEREGVEMPQCIRMYGPCNYVTIKKGS